MSESPDQRVKAALAALEIEHELMDCDPQYADTALFCEHYGIAIEDSANCILVVGKSDPRKYAACVLLADSRLDVNKVIRKKFGTKKASFASAEETTEITGMIIGGVTPLDLPDDLPLWIDARVMSRDSIVLGGGSRDLKVVVSPKVFDLTPNTEIVEDLAKPIPAPS